MVYVVAAHLLVDSAAEAETVKDLLEERLAEEGLNLIGVFIRKPTIADKKDIHTAGYDPKTGDSLDGPVGPS